MQLIRAMVFNATFNNIPGISRRSVLLVEKTGIPGEDHRPVGSHCPKELGQTAIYKTSYRKPKIEQHELH